MTKYYLQLIKPANQMNFIVLITAAFQNTGYVMDQQIAMMPQMRGIVVSITCYFKHLSNFMLFH